MKKFFFFLTEGLVAILFIYIAFGETSGEYSSKARLSDCPEGWLNGGEELGCFYLQIDSAKVDLSWVEAQDQCEQLGGFLAEPKSKKQHELLVSEAKIYEKFAGKRNWWIGLTKLGHEGSWFWEHSAVALDFSMWAENNLNTYTSNPEDCVLMDSSTANYDWKYVHCWEENIEDYPTSFICQKDTASIETTTTTGTTANGCEDGWHEFGSNCYKFFEELDKNWYWARDNCRNNYDSRIVSIHSSEENEFVLNMVTPSCGSIIWLGGHHDWSPVGYYWEDGSKFDYENWAQISTTTWPTTYADDHCIGMVTNFHAVIGKWVDKDCLLFKCYACKRTI